MSIIQDIRHTFAQRDNALKQLILLNVLVYVVLVVLGAILGLSRADGIFNNIMLQLQLPSNLLVLARHPWTILTYSFTHTSFWHILFNMLVLYSFGQLVREYLGDRRLVSLYILGGLAGAALFLLAYNLIPKLVEGPGAVVIGASGAVTAIIVGAATQLPNYTFMFMLLGPVRIKYIAAVVVLISIAGVNSFNTGGEIAHLGGALLGFVFIKQLQAGRDLGRPVQAIGSWFSRLSSPRPTMKASTIRRTEPGASGPRKAADQSLQDEVDLILDKISRSGYESLSKEEKQKLFQASQK
jgi:membrane associated rhomboid family serine protease